MAELLGVARLLRAARVLYSSVRSFTDERIVKMRALTEHLMFDRNLEEDIGRKILNENELSDHASEKLFSLRSQIRQLGERIRARLQGYLAGEEKKYLQDGIVTVRGDRFVIPVKAEYKRSVKGFVLYQLAVPDDIGTVAGSFCRTRSLLCLRRVCAFFCRL